MQRKIILNAKNVQPGIYLQDGQKKLHSIPIINKVKSNVLYSIPCSCVFALLLVGFISLFSTDTTYAAEESGEAGDITSTTSTASLTLTNPIMKSIPVSEGGIATASTDVKVEVTNAESYSLTLAVDNANLTNGSTTIKPGNVVDNNTWGYKWDNASAYTAPTTTGTNLTVPALTNNSVSFTKNLTFGAKFGTNTDVGTYHASGSLKLVATPRVVVQYTYTLNFDPNNEFTDDALKKFHTDFPEQSSGLTSATRHTFTIPNLFGTCYQGKDGYDYNLTGWSSTANGNIEFNASNLSVTLQSTSSNKTLYAKWYKEEFWCPD